MTSQASNPLKFTDAVGFSKLDCFRDCPAKFMYQFIKKLPQPSSPALERGSKIHDNCEAFLRGWVQTLEFPTADHWQDRFDDLRKLNCKTEAAWGFNNKWELLSDWLQPTTWLRAKSDAHYLEDEETLVVIDFKTGKYRVPSTEQIELYAICGGSVYPNVKKVITEFWFLDANNVYSKAYTAEHLRLLRRKYEDFFAPLYTEEQWAPSPSMACKWCAYSCSKNGPCQY